ncbi:MAG: fluoride efflux transporter CrcB [Cyanobacteria bacterium]|nr:fluoride efflux transporter CrcB [Cyanobacteriota bacterium]
MGYFLIFLGSGIGGVFRYLLSSTIQRYAIAIGFPFGTFVVNMIGCLIIGFLAQIGESKGIFSSDVRLFIFVGLLGGFTTFSSFGYETFQLLRDGQYLYAAANAILQVVLGVLFVFLGYILGRLI